MNEKELYQMVYEKNGETQKIVAIEEMSELIKEICKDFRGKVNRDNIVEEFVDVTIMLEQLKMIYKITDDEIMYNKWSKIERLKKQLNDKVRKCV